MATITRSGSKLTVEAMKHENANIAKRIFDLSDHKGERVRVHIDTEGKYTVETKPRQALLVCELDVPMREYTHTVKIVAGETVVESKEKALKLEEIKMIEYLKEEGKQI